MPHTRSSVAHAHHAPPSRFGGWALTATALAAGLIVAPAVLPALGIGSYDAAAEIATSMHGTDFGTGLAGFWNEALSHIPLAGGTLAAGGLGSAAIAAGLGLGGLVIGSGLQRDGASPLQASWGGFIRNAALATTILISLPSLLTGISIGVAFLAYTIGGVALASQATGAMASTLGTTGGISAATSATSLGALTGHLVTCGSALAPLAGNAALSRMDTRAQMRWQDRVQTSADVVIARH